jgi:hypothetical protein
MCPNWGAWRDALACPPPADYVPHHVAMGGFVLRMSAGMGGGWSCHSARDPPCSTAGRSCQRRCIFFGPIAEWLDENKLRIGSGQTCGHASSICPQEIDLERWCTRGTNWDLCEVENPRDELHASQFPKTRERECMSSVPMGASTRGQASTDAGNAERAVLDPPVLWIVDPS